MVLWLVSITLAAVLGSPPPTGTPSSERLQRYERARAFEKAADIDAALLALGTGNDGRDPLSVALRFHAQRLQLFEGKLPDTNVAELISPKSGPRIRWGITRAQEAWTLMRLADLQARVAHPDAAKNRYRAVVEYPRWVSEPADASREILALRAKNLVRDMDYDAALDVYERLHDTAQEPERAQLARTIGRLLGDKMRDDYPRVARIYRELSSLPDASPDDVLYWAYAVGKFDPAGSSEIYRDFAARFPRHSDKTKALFFVIWTHYDLEQFEEAVEGFTHFLRAYPGSSWRYSARWYRGLSLYRLGHHEQALEDFRFTARASSDRTKGRYWCARSLLELGRREEANDLLVDIASGDSFSYYPMMARELLPDELRPPLYDNDSVPPALTLRSDVEIERIVGKLKPKLQGLVRETVAASQQGNIELGQAMLEHLEGAGLGAVTFESLHRWLRAHVDAAHREVRSRDAQRCRRMLDDDPKDARVRECWARLYPTPYAQRIEAVRGEVPATLFWAIMRQESFFIPNARSHADALGLMQVIPQVGRPAARALGESFAAYELYRPRNNLRLFAHAANERFRRFGGHVPLILMSYNATPEKARAWLENHRDLPFDLFVEEIPYGETRDYVKRISSHLARYRTLVGDDAPILRRAGLPHPLAPVREAFGDVLRNDQAQGDRVVDLPMGPKAI